MIYSMFSFELRWIWFFYNKVNEIWGRGTFVFQFARVYVLTLWFYYAMVINSKTFEINYKSLQLKSHEISVSFVVACTYGYIK